MRPLSAQPGTAGMPPDTHGSGSPGRWRRLASALAILAVLAAGSVVGSPPPAQAATHGAGFDIGLGFLGAYRAEVDGRQVYCIDQGAPAPFSTTSSPQTVTTLFSHTGAQLTDTVMARLNYALSRWGQSPDPTITAALAMYVWSIADSVEYGSHGMDGDVYFIGRVPSGSRPAVLSNLAAIRAETAANAIAHPSVELGLTMIDQFNGMLSVEIQPASLTGSVVLTNARFADGTTSKPLGSGDYPIVGAPPSGAPDYQITASAGYGGPGLGAHVNLYTTPGAQRLLADGTPGSVTDQVQTPVIDLDFQPIIGTQVAARYVAEGDAFVDQLTVDTVGTGAWIRVQPPVLQRVEEEAPGELVLLTAKGTLYGPFDEQPAESEVPPADAPIVGTETVLLDHGPGEYESAGTLTATGSGFYAWVWEIDKAGQGDNARYIRDSFRDWFGRVAETHVTPFQPVAVSRSDARLAVPGDEVTDTLEVSSTNGAWLRIDGEPIPVVFDGTAYRVPGVLPPLEQTGVPEDAVPLGSAQVTATGPGSYTSPPVVFPEPGFVTWVWTMNLSSQPQEYVDYLLGDWVDNYGVPVESTSVRHPARIGSELREYNVHLNGRAFDEVTLSGFPDDHGDFTGDGYWGADVDEVTNTVYGPFATDEVLTDDLDLSDAPVLTSISIPARNGTYRIGYTDEDQIRPTEPGYYVVVSEFLGDDRVQQYRSSPADILERFYVPAPPPPVGGVLVLTKATPQVFVGEDLSDTALVYGQVPEGSYLVFRAYGPYDVQPTAEEELEAIFTSDPIPVNGPGRYESGTTSVTEPGLVFWIETLHASDGAILSEGFLGAPHETTLVLERDSDLTVSTRAVPEVALGEPAHDVAIVAGTIPEGTTLVFEAFRQEGEEPVCDADTIVFATNEDPLEVAEPGEYVSAEVVFDRVGVYFWIETLVGDDGSVLLRGVCGAEGETTVVTAVPDQPGNPDQPKPPVLAFTGADGWMIWGGGILALMLLAGGAVLFFGRRLAQQRERDGYVRDEDLEADLTAEEDVLTD